MVLADSHGISRVPRYSGTYPASQQAFVYGAFTLYGRPFQAVQLACCYGNSPALRPDRPYNPTVQARWFGLFRVRSPLLAESLLFSFPPGTEMVHFPGLTSPPYVFRWRSRGLPSRGCPIRKSSGQSLFAAHRSLSQLTTSFIDSWRQGIHRTPLVA